MLNREKFMNNHDYDPTLGFNAELIKDLIKKPLHHNAPYLSRAQVQAQVAECERIVRGYSLPQHRCAEGFEGLVQVEREYSLAIWQGSCHRRFPAELLSLIFIEAMTDCKFTTANLQPLVNLMHVCKKWYEAATSTPQLWNSITLPVRSPLPPSPTQDIMRRASLPPKVWPPGDKLKSWVGRSGQLPLTLEIGEPERDSILSYEWLMPLLAERNRWESLKMLGLLTTENFIFSLRKAVASAATIPQGDPTAELQAPIDPEGNFNYILNLAYNTPLYEGPVELPNLQSLTLSHVLDHYGFQAQKMFNELHAPRLRTLILQSVFLPGEMFAALFASAPNLLELWLHDAELHDLPELDLSQSKLESLSIQQNQPDFESEEVPAMPLLFSDLLIGCNSLKSINIDVPYGFMTVWRGRYHRTARMRQCPSATSLEVEITANSADIQRDSKDYFSLHEQFLNYFPGLLSLTINLPRCPSPSRYEAGITHAEDMVRTFPNFIPHMPNLEILSFNCTILAGQTFMDVLGSFTDSNEAFRDMFVHVKVWDILMPAGQSERRPWEMEYDYIPLHLFEQLAMRYCQNLKFKVEKTKAVRIYSGM